MTIIKLLENDLSNLLLFFDTLKFSDGFSYSSNKLWNFFTAKENKNYNSDNDDFGSTYILKHILIHLLVNQKALIYLAVRLSFFSLFFGFFGDRFVFVRFSELSAGFT